jgi:hypothetical protein
VVPTRVDRDVLRTAAAAVAAAAVTVGVLSLGAAGLDRDDDATGRRTATVSVAPSAVPDKLDRVPTSALLPDMGILPAEELGITGRGDRRGLRFAAVLTNVGIGPLQVDPDPVAACPPRQRHVLQTVYLDADGDSEYTVGTDTRTVPLPGGCMVFHPRHEHWHFDGSAGYALTTVFDATPLVARRKVSFCLRDSERNPAAVVRDGKTYPSCARDRRQGISAGWADRYDASLPGQRLPLPAGFAAGRYCLRLAADPFDQLAEVDETNNGSAIVVRITGRTVSRVADATCGP